MKEWSEHTEYFLSAAKLIDMKTLDPQKLTFAFLAAKDSRCTQIICEHQVQS